MRPTDDNCSILCILIAEIVENIGKIDDFSNDCGLERYNFGPAFRHVGFLHCGRYSKECQIDACITIHPDPSPTEVASMDGYN
jgi:hypothetical protein